MMMWFKQVTVYKLGEKIPDIATLNEKLASCAFAPPQGLDWFGDGFVQPFTFADKLVFKADNTWRIALSCEEKVLPSAVINKILDEKILEIERTESRNVGRKEKQELKEQITDDLLPRSFTRVSQTQAIIDVKNGYLFINAVGAKAENVLSKLREALGGFEAKLIHTKESPNSLMTRWVVAGNCAGGFEFDNDVTFKGVGDVCPTVKVRLKDVTDDDVAAHAKNGMGVIELGLVWHDKLAFTLTDNFVIKRIKYLDMLQEEAENQGDDKQSLAFASQILMSDALSTITNEMISHLGGVQD